MSLRKALIALVVSCAMISNSVVIAAASMNQSSRINDMIASGDIVVDQNLDSDIGLSVLENPEDVDAGEPITLSVIALALLYSAAHNAVESGMLAVIDKGIEEKANSEPESDLIEYLKIAGVAGGEGIIDSLNPKELFGYLPKVKTYLNILGNMPEYTLSVINDYYVIANYLYNNLTSQPPSTIQSLSELVKGGEFSTSSDLAYWTEKSNAKAGYSSFGSISYPGASSDQLFGFVHTGLGATSDQGSMLQTVLPIKNSSAVFTARYNFVTTEFPQFLGSQFNDSFVIKIEDIESGATKVLASFSGSLNTLFDPNDPVVQNLPAEFLDMVASGGGQTGWVTESSDQIALKANGKYRIYIDVRDVGDKIYDSALLIDKVSLR